MQNLLNAVLATAIVLIVYVGPVLALALSAYWAYGVIQTGGGLLSAFVTFAISALVLLIALWVAKKVLKIVVNMVDTGDEAEPAAKD